MAAFQPLSGGDNVPLGAPIPLVAASPMSNVNLGPPPPAGSEASKYFNHVIGELPFVEPNIRQGYEMQDLSKIVPIDSASDWGWSALCCLTGLGACYVCAKSGLIKEGKYGLAIENGRPKMIMPGYYTLPSPFASLENEVSTGDDTITFGPVSIIRVPIGCYGFASNDGRYEILTPGIHARNQGTWKFIKLESLGVDLIVQGPLKLLTVRSGTVRICYRQGRVHIYPEGRYAVNDATFQVAGVIATTQQNVRFESHTVLLDGGISMLVEGLLTYQVTTTKCSHCRTLCS